MLTTKLRTKGTTTKAEDFKRNSARWWIWSEPHEKKTISRIFHSSRYSADTVVIQCLPCSNCKINMRSRPNWVNFFNTMLLHIYYNGLFPFSHFWKAIMHFSFAIVANENTKICIYYIILQQFPFTIIGVYQLKKCEKGPYPSVYNILFKVHMKSECTLCTLLVLLKKLIKNQALPSIQYSVSYRNTSQHWNTGSYNFQFTRTLTCSDLSTHI